MFAIVLLSDFFCSLLYAYFLEKFKHVVEFDEQTAILGLECFSECCLLATSVYYAQLDVFLESLCKGNIITFRNYFKYIEVTNKYHAFFTETLSFKNELTKQIYGFVSKMKELTMSYFQHAEESNQEWSLRHKIILLFLQITSNVMDSLPFGDKCDQNVGQWKALGNQHVINF